MRPEGQVTFIRKRGWPAVIKPSAPNAMPPIGRTDRFGPLLTQVQLAELLA